MSTLNKCNGLGNVKDRDVHERKRDGRERYSYERNIILLYLEMYKSANGLDEINWERNPVVNAPKDRSLMRLNGV